MRSINKTMEFQVKKESSKRNWKRTSKMYLETDKPVFAGLSVFSFLHSLTALISINYRNQHQYHLPLKIKSIATTNAMTITSKVNNFNE